MRTYIKLTRYMHGNGFKEQINEALATGRVDVDTVFFLSKNNMLTTEDIAELLRYFDISRDLDFDNDNVVFKPTKYLLREIEAKGKEAIV